jgi:predicted nucleotidyltransferase
MATKKANSDLIELLSSLVEEKVKFLIVGGYALAYHYEPRFTKDIDIWIDNSVSNAKKVYGVLKEFGAPVSSIDYSYFTFEDHFLKMGKDPTRIDIICGMEVLAFGDAWKAKVKGKLFDVPVNYISLDHLILLKKKAGRPQDLVDVKNLSIKK